MKTNEKPTKETKDAWHDDPKNWKLGVFYYNPLDKRILPPKRIRWTGWTVNFANPYSYLTLIGIIIVAMILSEYF
jgi:uncharacterized membrane protein